MPEDKCDPVVFKDGESIAVLEEGRLQPKAVTDWLKEVAKSANATLDWHYSGGWAHVLHLGDTKSRQRAEEALRSFSGKDGIMLVRIITSGSAGLYRAGVTSVPEDTIAVAYDGGDSPTIFVEDT
jgi:hypothetical protein